MAKLPDDLFLIDPPDDLKQLYYVIGRTIVIWSAVERMLTMCVIVIHGSYWGATLPGYKEIPVSLKNKIGFIRKALNNNELGLLTFKDEGLKIMDHINDLKEARHNITHGMLIDMNQDSFDLQKLKYGTQTFDDLKINIKIDDCLEVGNKMLVLVEELAHFFWRRLLRQKGP